MVVYLFVNSHAGKHDAAAGEPASAVSGAWWCMVVYGGVWWCISLLIVTHGKMLLPVHGGVWWCMVVCPFVNCHAGHDGSAGGSESEWECTLQGCGFTTTVEKMHQHYWTAHPAFVGGDGEEPQAHVRRKRTGEEFAPHNNWKLNDEQVQFLKEVFPSSPPPPNAHVNAACDWLERELQEPLAEFVLSRLVPAFREVQDSVLPIVPISLPVDSEEVQTLFLKAVFPETPPPSNADVTAACDWLRRWLRRNLEKPVAEAFKFSCLVSAFKEEMEPSIVSETDFSSGVPLHPPLICLTLTQADSDHGDEGAFVYGGVHYSEQWCMVEYRRCKRRDVWIYLPCPDVQHPPATADEAVLKDWSFVALKNRVSKRLGFRLVGTLVAHPSVDQAKLGQDWFSTEIAGIQSEYVVRSSNKSSYRLVGPAAPQQRSAEPRLAAIMQPFCESTWPPNATALFQNVSDFFRPAHEATRQKGPSLGMFVYGGVRWCMLMCRCIVLYG